MRKYSTLVLSLLTILIFAPKVHAANFTLWLNGTNPAYEEDAPYLKQGRVMVPLRLISESFGFDVTWNGASRTVSMTPANDRIKSMPVFSLNIGGNAIYADGRQTVTTDVPAEIRNNYTFVPLRVIAELFGYQVRWNEAERAAIIGSDTPVPYINRFKMKNMNLIVDGKNRGSLNAFAENGQLYVSVNQLAKSLDMISSVQGIPYENGASDWEINLQEQSGWFLYIDEHGYTYSSDGLNFGRYDSGNYKIVHDTPFISLGRYADAKHMSLKVKDNSIILTTDTTPTAYPITIMRYFNEYSSHFYPTKTTLFIYWDGTKYVLRDHQGKDLHFGHYIDYLFSEEGYKQIEDMDDEAQSELRFGDNNHYYLQRQAGMVIGGISD